MYQVTIDYQYMDHLEFRFDDILTATEFMRIALPALQARKNKYFEDKLTLPTISLTTIIDEQPEEVKEDEHEE